MVRKIVSNQGVKCHVVSLLGKSEIFRREPNPKALVTDQLDTPVLYFFLKNRGDYINFSKLICVLFKLYLECVLLIMNIYQFKDIKKLTITRDKKSYFVTFVSNSVSYHSCQQSSICLIGAFKILCFTMACFKLACGKLK